jgi:diguanylate cyclase (GGDEF)-like protein
MRSTPRRSIRALAVLAIGLAFPAFAAAIAQPATRAEYEAFRKAQDAASNEAYRAGDYARCRAIEEASLQAARRFGDDKEEAASIYGLALVDVATGRLDDAERRFRQTIGMAQATGSQKRMASSMRGLGRVLEARGRMHEAAEVEVAALALLLEHGEPMDQSESYYSLAKLFVGLENLPAAKVGVDRAIALMGKSPPDFPLGLNLVLRSHIERESGDAKAALADAEAAVAAFARADSRLGGAIGQFALGNALAVNGEPERGLALLRAGEATAVALDDATLRADLLLSEGTVLNGMQRHAEALPPLQEAAAITTRLSLDSVLRDVNLELEKANSALGRTADALAASKAAFAAQTRIAGLDKIGEVAGRSAESQLADVNSRFMSLDPASSAGDPDPAAPAVPAAKPASRRAAWSWWMLLPLLALATAIAFAVRYLLRLRSRQRRLESEHRQLRRQVTLDPLTGTLARRAFVDELAAQLQHAQAQGATVSLLVFDLDHFKRINDRHGHLTGDAALKLLAGLVREQLDSADLFGRFGGDEFLVACRQAPDAAHALAERLRASVEQRSRFADSGLPPLAISIGLAHAGPDAGYDPEALFLRADAALYAAKDAGRNRVVVGTGVESGGDPRSLLQPASDTVD